MFNKRFLMIFLAVVLASSPLQVMAGQGGAINATSNASMTAATSSVSTTVATAGVSMIAATAATTGASTTAATTGASTTAATTGAASATTSATTSTKQENASSESAGSEASSQLWPEAPAISAESAVLIDADSGAVLYEKNAHSKAYPASTTKIMTALLTIENCALDDTITFSRAAANSYNWDEANMATKEGEEITVEQALYAILLKSANEVAYGLGEYISGSIPEFANLMNERAKELGALDTHFNNANGLSDPDHYTTAYDLAMIGRACFDNTTFMNISSYSDTYRIPATNKTSTERSFTQRHGMAKNNGYAYEYFKGGKTGFTDESGYTLITFVQKDDLRLICVVLKENDDTARYVDTKALCDYGFNNFTKNTVSSDNISSLFNSSSYYNSGVFGSSTLNFTMNSSYVDLPNDVALDQVTTTVTPDDTADGADFSATVSFTLEGHDLGSTKVLVNVDKSRIASNLPASMTVQTTDYKQKKAIVINIWLVLIVLVGIGIILEMLDIRKDNRELRRRRRRARKRNR